MEFKIGLANRIIGITSLYDEVYTLCKEYMVDGNEDFHITISLSDIAFEREKSIKEAQFEGIAQVIYPDSYLETLAVYRKIVVEMLRFDTFLMHGAVIGTTYNTKREAVLFTAKSGVGKTTHINLWLKNIPDTFVVNGDKPLLMLTVKGFNVCGTPWAGKESLQTNAILPLRAICFIERSEANSIEQVKFEECYPMLFQQIYRPSTATEMMKTMELIRELGSRMPLYRLRCNMEPDAAWEAYKGIFG